MNRIAFVGIAVLLALFGKGFLRADEHPPNVLFIAVDDLRDWVGHLDRHPNVKTPSIDRLAERGVSFSRAYCSAPLCNPSRVSLLTGVAPHRSGVYGNGEVQFRKLIPDAVTLMQHFRASGYVARGSGKIFHGRTAGDPASWDQYFTTHSSARKIRKIGRDKTLPESAWTPWGPLDCTDKDLHDGKVATWVASELDKPSDKPFFLAVSVLSARRPAPNAPGG